MINQNTKKIIILILFFSSLKLIYSQSLIELSKITLENNSDILSAQDLYESVILSSKTINGAYSPQLSFSSSATLSDKFSWNRNLHYLSSSISYVQPLLGGSTISITGETIIKRENISTEFYLSQSSNISISLQQSLLPFWIQGRLKDPAIENILQQKQYYYNQLLNTRKNILINLAQNYIYALIYQNQFLMLQNSIILINEQIDALKQLKKNGASSLSKITELLNSKYTLQKDLISIQSNIENYIQNIKILCNSNLKINQLVYPIISTEDFLHLIQKVTDNNLDLFEKNYHLTLEMFKLNRILDKQTSAPIISISIQPSWTMEQRKKSEITNIWKELRSPSNCSATIGINLSPFISATLKQNKEQYKLNYKSILNSYTSYKIQKKAIQEQYKNLFEQHKKLLEENKRLYNEGTIELRDMKLQYNAGSISLIDYDSMRIRIENCNLNMQICELYVWLYELLLKVNQ